METIKVIFNLPQLINGIQLGSIYALIALGYTMVYGIIRLINFAHGDFFMIGAYAAFFASSYMLAVYGKAPLVIIIIVSMLVSAFIALLTNRVIYRPLRYKPRLSGLIGAIGASLFIEYLFSSLPFIGPSFRAFPDVMPRVAHQVGNVYISNHQISNLAISIGLMLFLTYIVRKTAVGKAMRAVSLDKDAAKLMGIDVEKIISFTFFLGGSFAGAAGLMASIAYPRIFPYMGILPGLKAFVSAVLGGIGSIPGAMLGGYIVGLAETFATAYKSLYGEGIAFAILVLVLLFRPQGLLGEKTAEKI